MGAVAVAVVVEVVVPVFASLVVVVRMATVVVGVICGCAHVRAVIALWYLHWKRQILWRVSTTWVCLAVSGR